jgi:hypothetical protein
VLAGNGDGTFQAPRSTPHSAPALEVFALATGDFNGDGKLDLIEASDQPKALSVLLGNGDATFQVAGESTDTLPASMALGDFNGDGRTDMAVVSLALGSITILLGDGQGGFTVAQQIALGSVTSAGTPVVGDFNGDGRLDLAVITVGPDFVTRSLVVLLGNGDVPGQDIRHPKGCLASGSFRGGKYRTGCR